MGRDDKDEACINLKEALKQPNHKIIQFIGANGIGKSSYIQAFLIPHLEESENYKCFYVNAPIVIEEINLKFVWNEGDAKTKTVVFVDHFGKILRQFKHGSEGIKKTIHDWCNGLAQKITDDAAFVFVCTSDEYSPQFTKLFRRDADVLMEELTAEQFKLTITGPLKKIYGETVIFKEELVQRLVDLYKAFSMDPDPDRRSQALTYVQALCYKLMKEKKFENPKDHNEILKRGGELEEIIVKNLIGNIIKNLYEKEDRIIFIELIKSMLEHSPDLLTTIDKDSLRKLINYQYNFPEEISSKT